jgi:CRP-like cAMP-binding protein
MECVASVTCYRTGQPIYHAEDTPVRWHRIIAGSARLCIVMPDGKRQVIDFLFPGDLFGFGHPHEYGCSAESIGEGTVIACYPRARAETLTENDPHAARQFREATFAAIARLQSRQILLGRRTSLARVCSFLMQMSDRIGESAPGTIALPMSRYDIADYLAVAVETVSRTLTTLQNIHVMTLRGSRLMHIADPRMLASLAEEEVCMSGLLTSVNASGAHHRETECE